MCLALIHGSVWAQESAENDLFVLCQAALDEGRASQVLRLLKDRDIVDYSSLHWAQAQAEAAVRGPTAGIMALGVPKPIVGSQLEAWLVKWPLSLQGGIAQAHGLWTLQENPQARHGVLSLGFALEKGGSLVDRDRCFAAIAIACYQQGRMALAESYAHVAWAGGEPPWSWRAGEIYARILVQRDPTQAMEVWRALLRQPMPSTDSLRVRSQCAEDLWQQFPAEIIRLTEAQRDLGDIPLWRSLALTRLDAQRGLKAMQQLVAPFNEHPLVVEHRQQLRRAEQEDSPAARIGRAQAALALGEHEQARTLLDPLAFEHVEALVSLLSLPQVNPKLYTSAASARFGRARLALIQALARRNEREAAKTLLAKSLTEGVFTNPSEHAQALALGLLLHKGSQGYQLFDEALRSLSVSHRAVGEAWAREAIRLEQAREAAGVAWQRAISALPAVHQWAPIAAERATRAALVDWSPLDPVLAADDPRRTAIYAIANQVEAIAWSRDDEAVYPVRYVLAQAYLALGEAEPAIRLLSSLMAVAEGARQQRLAALLQRARLMESAGASDSNP